jgi:ribonuclease PH
VRPDGRTTDQLRPVRFTRRFTDLPAGSVLVGWGRNVILCTVSVESRIPPWLVGKGQGWATAEYSMLPAATTTRKMRDSARMKPDSRNVEISRLIGRAVRSVLDLKAIGERTLWVDCDVIRADGGTRTAAISGAYVALHDALKDLEKDLELRRWPLETSVAAVSVGVVDGEPRLDLAYEEDVKAAVDMNVVMTGDGRIVEVQGTGEERPFTHDEHLRMMELAAQGVVEVTRIQEEVLAEKVGE